MNRLSKWAAAIAAVGFASCAAAQVATRGSAKTTVDVHKAPIDGTVIVDAKRDGSVIIDSVAMGRQSKEPMVLDLASGSPGTVGLIAAMGRVQVLQAQISAQEQELAITKARVSAGVQDATTLPGMEAKLVELRSQLPKAQADLVRARRFAALEHKVTFNFKNARIRDAASVLSRVSSRVISVSDSVPISLVITTKGHDVPLGAALELIASATDLCIEAADDGGMKLVSPVKVKVGGKTVIIRSADWPWGDDLVNLSVYGQAPPIGLRWHAVAQSYPVKVTWTPQLTEKLALTPPNFTEHVNVTKSHRVVDPIIAGADHSGAGRLTVTALGSNMIVVTEPGTGPHSESGWWLTVYKVRNGKLVATGTTFHKSRARRVVRVMIRKLDKVVPRTFQFKVVPLRSGPQKVEVKLKG